MRGGGACLQETVSRLPYLSEGEFDCPLFTLDDAIFVLSVDDNEVSADADTVPAP
jgi:hypothetical protein